VATHLQLEVRSENAWSYTSTPLIHHGVVLSESTGTTLPLPLMSELKELSSFNKSFTSITHMMPVQVTQSNLDVL